MSEKKFKIVVLKDSTYSDKTKQHIAFVKAVRNNGDFITEKAGFIKLNKEVKKDDERELICEGISVVPSNNPVEINGEDVFLNWLVIE